MCVLPHLCVYYQHICANTHIYLYTLNYVCIITDMCVLPNIFVQNKYVLKASEQCVFDHTYVFNTQHICYTTHVLMWRLCILKLILVIWTNGGKIVFVI